MTVLQNDLVRPKKGTAGAGQAISLEVELRRTRPDYVVYHPRSRQRDAGDTGNEHFLVFNGPEDALMAVWTQSTREADPDQHIMFTRSDDEGKTWSSPQQLAGPPMPGAQHMASWAFPMVSHSGRIYVLYNQHVGKYDTFNHHAGIMAGIYSDDAGQTWSEPQTISMPRSHYDNPDASYPAEWIVWQRPDRLSEGKYFVGFTRWVSKAVRHKPPIESWIAVESVVEFMRFDNLDDDPQPHDLSICFIAANDQAVRVPYPNHPELSVAQEPSLIRLPDGRLFCVMRTSTGSPWWTQSADDGLTWSEPTVLRQCDGGPALRHPLSPCPIYDLGGDARGSGRYVHFIHNNDGHYKHWKPTDCGYHRRPIYAVYGTFDAQATQPISFDAPQPFMDQGEVGLGPSDRPRYDLSLYASFTVRRGRPVLWYPDRKFFLLGKDVPDRSALGIGD